ncbi:MAG: acyl-CoA dehydrogenase family protein [Lautropia sp.]
MSQWADILGEPIDRLLRQRCDDARVHEPGGTAWATDLWNELERIGATLALVSEELGGAGVPFVETASIMRAAGYHAAPLPIVESMLAHGVLSQLGHRTEGGPLALAMAPAGSALHAQVSGSRLRLGGHAAAVPWARHLDAVLAIASAEGRGQTAITVPLQKLAIRPGVNAAGEPRDALSFDGVEVDASTLTWADADLASLWWRRSALARCQQMAGAMQWIRDRTLAYAMERRQFGRAIGEFQSVQHLMARLYAHVSAATMAADIGLGVSTGVPLHDDVASAKSVVGEAAGAVAAIAHQLHGAMGYSWEYPLHHRTRRLWAWRDEFGNEREWQIALGRRAAARGAIALWENLTLP